MVKIDIDDAIDRLQCMAREINPIGSANKILDESQKKGRELLLNLIPIVRAIGNLS